MPLPVFSRASAAPIEADVGPWSRLAVESPRAFSARRDVVREGDPVEFGLLLQAGWACRYKIMADGRRQILAFCLPGDLIEVGRLSGQRADHAISTITAATVVTVPHAVVEAVVATDPGFVVALDRNAMVAAAIQRDWMVSLGVRSALERVAHLFCELLARARQTGLASGDGFVFPLTQVDLGDALGLTSVHVNRMVRTLREQRLITIESGVLTIDDVAALQRIGQYDGTARSRTEGKPGGAAAFR